MKIVYPTWLTKCDAGEIDKADEEATVDCYGDEQGAALVDKTIQELAFPYAAVVLGQPVSVVDAIPSRNAGFGVDLIVEYGKKQFAISASSIELCHPFPEGHLYFAALLVWHSRM